MKVSARGSYDYLGDLYKGSGAEAYYGEGMTVGKFISNLLPWVYGLATVILLFCIVMAAFKFLTKNKDGVADAKKMLMYGLIGFLIVAGAAVITQFILGFFDVGNLNVFK